MARQKETGWMKASAVKMLRNGTVLVRSSRNSRSVANVAEGFYDSGGIFHPIRHSSDYSETRGGDLRLRGGQSVRSFLSPGGKKRK